MITVDEDALHAAVDLCGRAGAREFEVGHLHDDVPVERAAWWAHAQLRGARISVEGHRGPVEAAEALAVRMLSGAMCTHCGGLIALSDQGAEVYPGQLIDGSAMTEERARSMRHCRWHRHADRWVRGCVDLVPEGQRRAEIPHPNRAARRAARRRR